MYDAPEELNVLEAKYKDDPYLSQTEIDLLSAMDEYKDLDEDWSRPWGGYKVLSISFNKKAGWEVCEKEILVNPGFALSLQQHRGRRERWRVLEGELTVIVNGDIKTYKEGEEAFIPFRAVHCMANMSDKPVRVHEVQEGPFCREEDNKRILDQGNRPVDPAEDSVSMKSKEVYASRFMNRAPA